MSTSPSDAAALMQETIEVQRLRMDMALAKRRLDALPPHPDRYIDKGAGSASPAAVLRWKRKNAQ